MTDIDGIVKVYADQHAMRLGPREYTAEQAEFIERVVASRQPLATPPLPIESDRSNP